MSIQLHLKDGSIKVGGDFKSALARVKGNGGFRWNPGAKRWENPAMSVKDARLWFSGYPLDGSGLRGAFHTTAYGNSYTADEWQADKEARKEAGLVHDSFFPQYDALDKEARSRLDKLGVPYAHQSSLMDWSFENNVERGAIQFSSRERETEIRAFVEWYQAEKHRLQDEEYGAAEAAKERVWERYGIE